MDPRFSPLESEPGSFGLQSLAANYGFLERLARLTPRRLGPRFVDFVFAFGSDDLDTQRHRVQASPRSIAVKICAPMRWLPPLALCVLAAGVRFFRIDAQSLWYDEGISAFQLTRSFAEILRAAALDTHPPLYYWTLKAWSEVFGASELGLRSLSAVSGVAAVGLTWLIGRKLFGRLPATLAAVLLAVAPLGVYYSQEVRMYTQVTALAMLAAYAYVRRG